MSAVSSVQGIFKRFYGDIVDLVPQELPITNMLKFDKRKRVGESYVEAVILNNETGLTLGGSNAEVVEINPASAGSVKQAMVVDFQTVMASVVPFQTLSRAAQAGDTAFLSASKHIVKNNLKSHASMKESLYLYGQAVGRLGALSFETTTYRGITITAGAGTFIPNASSPADTIVTATGGYSSGASNTGVYANRKFIFLGRTMASHIWVGMEGCPIQESTVSGAALTVVAQGRVVSVISEYGLLEIDFTATAATSQGQSVIAFPGSADNLELQGINSILATVGVLFGIDNTKFSLWKATQYNANGKITFQKLQDAVAQAVNRAGLDTDMTVLVNPRSWQTLLVEQAALRMYDSSYKASEVENGSGKIVFHSQNGKLEIMPAGRVKENEAYILSKDSLSRFGSAELSFKVPGSGEDELIKPLENQTGYAFRSYASDCIFCSMPAINVLITGVNDESST